MTRYAWIRERVKGMSFFDRVHLLPDMSHAEMPDVYRLADVTVSLTSHDGTPNSLLEALASGCLPVVSPLESVLEWVEHEVNGLVVDPTDTKAIVATLIRAVDDDQLRKSARHANITLVRERADLETCMERAIPFYQSILA
jgi:glycosyltransferase involved in cell wall biosynthesis